MSLPSGLIFFLDFTTSDDTGARGGLINPGSLYGGGKVGAEITGGVSLAAPDNERSFYNLNNGYSSPTGSSVAIRLVPVISGTFGASNVGDGVLKMAKLLNEVHAVSGTLEQPTCGLVGLQLVPCPSLT